MSKFRIVLFWTLLLLCIGVGLQHIPGTYTLEDFEDDYEPGSPEGIALLALSDATLSAELYFAEATRHRISRNAEIVVPANTTLDVKATTLPYIKNEEVILKPSTLRITSDQKLTFIYRFVTVATASVLEIQEHDSEQKVKAIGHYKVLSALGTAYRYKRQKEIRREYKIPTRAKVDFSANFYPDHEIEALEGVSIYTGSQAARLHLKEAVWSENTWQKGSLHLSVPFSDIEPTLNQLLSTQLASEIDVGSSFSVRLDRIHSLTFKENFLEFYVDGHFTYSKSSRVSKMFTPSFTAHLGVEFHLPSKTPLEEAQVGVEIKNVYSLDVNRSNPMIDNMLRDVIRKYRDEANIQIKVKEELPELTQLPGDLFLETLIIRGDEKGNPVLDVKILLKPRS